MNRINLYIFSQIVKSCTLVFFIFVTIAWLMQISRLFSIMNKMFFDSGWVVQKYLGQFPINKKSPMVNKYRNFIRQYWKYN